MSVLPPYEAYRSPIEQDIVARPLLPAPPVYLPADTPAPSYARHNPILDYDAGEDRIRRARCAPVYEVIDGQPRNPNARLTYVHFRGADGDLEAQCTILVEGNIPSHTRCVRIIDPHHEAPVPAKHMGYFRRFCHSIDNSLLRRGHDLKRTRFFFSVVREVYGDLGFGGKLFMVFLIVVFLTIILLPIVLGTVGDKRSSH